RAKLWLEKCGREINTSPENLYKNYKVCGDYFKSSMFLNDLKNRLQPHAIPELMENNNEYFELSSDKNATFNLNNDSEENTVISGKQFLNCVCVCMVGNIKNLVNIITIFQLSAISLIAFFIG
ncbi:52 kDa repressor of the inhibitor of the protein kinase, partial [Temnothorax longispinosus]